MKKVKDMFFKGKNIRGEVGIEIEMEGRGFPHEDLDSWYSKEDGSLRGDSREYVLIRPCKRDDVPARLESLSRDLKEVGATIKPSYRTGVHIHVNIRALTFVQTFNFIFTYMMLEHLMMEYAGEGRAGNLFCLRVEDAEGVMDNMRKVIKTKSLAHFHTDEVRYSSMNLKAIKQYGSIEFRGLPFIGDFEKVGTWASLLLAIKDYSLTLKTPQELAENISKLGPVKLCEEIFGDLLKDLPQDKWDTLLDGVRRAQPLIYSDEWKNEATYYVIKLKKGEQNEKINKAIQPNFPQPVAMENGEPRMQDVIGDLGLFPHPA